MDAADANWNIAAIASPRGDLVAVEWREQHIAGFELVAIHPDGDRQIEGAGYAVEPNMMSSPAFSPDGRYLVVGCGRYAWWNGGEDEELPSPGGRFSVGHMLIRDLDAGTQREVPVQVEVPTNWLPPRSDGAVSVDQPIGDPHFETTMEFSVPVLTGNRLRFSVQTT